MERDKGLTTLKKTKIILAIGMVCCFLLAGCKEEVEMTKKEEENFKGGPPPAGFLDNPSNQPKPGN